MLTKYDHTTLAKFRELCKEASGDLAGVCWPNSEWDNLIREALLTFGGLSGFWKDELTFATEENKRLYDIFVDPNSPAKTAPTITYGDILGWINRDLIETLSVGTPTSDLFTLTEILELIEDSYNLYQSLTNLIVTSYELDVEAENNIVTISNDTINLIRLIYFYTNDDGDIEETILEYVDEEEIGNFSQSSLTEEGTPQWFSTTYGSPNEIKLYPIPANSGKLKILSINGRDTIEELSVNVVVNLSNNLVPYLKYNVLLTIFSKDGLLNDPARVIYCNRRWKEGITVGKNYSSILIAKANGEIISTDSLNKLDSWITPESSDNPPNVLGLAGFNIFQVDTIPSSVVNSISTIITQNAPQPILDEDFIDVAIEYLSIILGYVVHLGQMKNGIGDIAATNIYFEDFIRSAINHNQRLQNRGISFETLVGKTKREEIEKPKLVVEQAG